MGKDMDYLLFFIQMARKSNNNNERIIRAEQYYIDNLLEGISNFWDINGDLQKQINFKNG
jgi:antitoxin component YwqK of YwqJK toxin-antitoxin module